MTTVSGSRRTTPQLAALARTTPNLKRLTLANNGIITVQQLEPLKNLPALRTVDLYSNTVTRAHHRQLVLAVPQVVRWDGDGGDFESDSDEEMKERFMFIEPATDSEEEDNDDDESMAESDHTWILPGAETPDWMHSSDEEMPDSGSEAEDEADGSGGDDVIPDSCSEAEDEADSSGGDDVIPDSCSEAEDEVDEEDGSDHEGGGQDDGDKKDSDNGKDDDVVLVE
ncbi:acidic leucine-rich nuclear phosphoprotein 32 family member B-like [Paramacrobiotus metropolitanus]|uniref:acidic leucine-rich nuclear phosphoprotein 32 family member B-like n=1 Tax=Paramacrobiotus metropolitanus TaxID=2943436 RepID=UPI00244589BD|nr:acidic leucine-rich nuclear phosphoprotein 32 family member B-like [Paramacrobiotus metropolitanus]